MDAFGHVNNARFVTLFEDARTELIARATDEAGLGGLMTGVVVARQEIDYLYPIRYQPEPVRIDTWMLEVRNASFKVGYEMFDPECTDHERVVARASTVIVRYDMAAGRPRRLEEAERAYLQQWLDPE